jgi:uncharacterized repeat protein (TIGR03847 family)
MARRLLSFDQPDRFVAGAVGTPGARTFYLQARKGAALVSVGIEKTQVAALAARMLELLELVGEVAESGEQISGAQQPLEEPLVEIFRAGRMALSWDASAALIEVEARSADADDELDDVADDDPDGPDLVRIRVALPAARGFVQQAAQLVQAGRPTCPFCGQPLEPGGHFCPRSNGHLN